jgi:hypothetical protein
MVSHYLVVSQFFETFRQRLFTFAAFHRDQTTIAVATVTAIAIAPDWLSECRTINPARSDTWFPSVHISLFH